MMVNLGHIINFTVGKYLFFIASFYFQDRWLVWPPVRVDTLTSYYVPIVCCNTYMSLKNKILIYHYFIGNNFMKKNINRHLFLYLVIYVDIRLKYWNIINTYLQLFLIYITQFSLLHTTGKYFYLLCISYF